MNILNNDVKNINLSKEDSHFFHLYKNESKIIDFKAKMKEQIKNIRSNNRQRNFDINRALATISQEDERIMKNCFYQASKATRKNKNKWSELMMLAEWFLAVPDEFHDEYYMKMCPHGRHVLVVSSKGKTSIFNKNGRMLKCVETTLPGGSPENGSDKSAVLDCIWDEKNGVIFVLDIVFYLKQDFQEMTAECRFAWLEEFLSSEISSASSSELRFEVVRATRCSRAALASALALRPPYKVDGLLLYWAEGVYVGGSSHLVGWLKPYMAPELLGIVTLHPDLLVDMPDDYDDFRSDIVSYNRKHGLKERAADAASLEKMEGVTEAGR